MACFQLRLSLPRLAHVQFFNTLVCPTSVAKSAVSLPASLGSLPRLHPPGHLHIGIAERVLEVGDFLETKTHVDLAKEQELKDEVQFDGFPQSLEDQNERKKKQRKRKKKHGNKGRLPWNKGIQHTEETRALIKQRTVEALKNPQVRKKMSEHPRPHSLEIKAKISSSLRRLWDKRLKRKRAKEKFFSMWAENIAKAAKDGGVGQQALDWDSYDTIEQEMSLHQLQSAVNKARTEKLEQIERSVRLKADKALSENQKRKKQNKKAKSREMTTKKRPRKQDTTAEGLSVDQRRILKKRLTKIRRKKPLNHVVINRREESISNSTTWKKLDLELSKRENFREDVSLADQIRAAKNQRLRCQIMEALEESSPIHSSARW